MHSRLASWAWIALLPLLASCGEDPELALEYEALAAEVGEREEELSGLQKQLGAEIPPALGEKLEKATGKLTELSVEQSRLEAKLVALRDEKRSLEMRFNRYRQEYPVP
ncbi:MAG: hypothetical protein R3242_00885 [Akkermansiaceae bacterium]|nr:hypothetical protein [Akkermansiaceae bacterium]